MADIIPLWLDSDSGQARTYEPWDTLQAITDIQWAFLPNNVVSVDPSMPEMVWARYQTIANALVYVATQKPSSTNRWAVMVWGTNAEDFTIPSWVMIMGTGSATRLTGAVSTETAMTTHIDEIELQSIEATNLVIEPSQYIFTYDCYLFGWTFTGWELISHASHYEGGDYDWLESHVANWAIVTAGTYWVTTIFQNSTVAWTATLNGSACSNSIITDSVTLWTGGTMLACSVTTPTITGDWNMIESIITPELTIADWQTVLFQSCTLMNTVTVDGSLTTAWCTGVMPTVGTGTWENVWDFFDNTGIWLSATDVQGAIEELNTDKKPKDEARSHTSQALAINTARTPSATNDVEVIITFSLDTDDWDVSTAIVQVDNSWGGTFVTIATEENDFSVSGVLWVTGSSNLKKSCTFTCPVGSQYKWNNTGTSGGTVTVVSIYELIK